MVAQCLRRGARPRRDLPITGIGNALQNIQDVAKGIMRLNLCKNFHRYMLCAQRLQNIFSKCRALQIFANIDKVILFYNK